MVTYFPYPKVKYLPCWKNVTLADHVHGDQILCWSLLRPVPTLNLFGINYTRCSSMMADYGG